MELADQPDLAPARDRGQRQRSERGWVENFERWVSQNDFSNSKSVIFFFFFLHCWRFGRVGSTLMRVRKKKKKEDTCRTLESGESYPFPCLTRVQHRHDAKNGMSVQPSLFKLQTSNLGQMFEYQSKIPLLWNTSVEA